MKRQTRIGMFETNSSSTHTLTIYKTKDWEDFKNGENVIDESWHEDESPCYKTKKEVMDSQAFKDWLNEGYSQDEIANFDEQDYADALAEFMNEECIWDYESYTEAYEVLEKKIPNSDYTAVSIYGQDY